MALEPEWEARFEPNSYSFRPGRSPHDAIEAIVSYTVAIKFSLSGLGPFISAAVRFGASTLFLWAWAKLSGQPLRPAPGQLPHLVINSLLFTLQLSLVYVGFTLTSASRGALITNLQPFFLLFLAHFFLAGDRITLLKSIGLILGFAGAACIFLDRGATSGDLMTGDLLLLAATFVWACSAAYTKHLIRNISSMQLVFYQLLFSIPLFALGAPLWDAPMVARIDVGIVAAIAFQVVLTTAFAFVAWNRLMQAHGAVAQHSFVFLIPVSGVLLAGVLLPVVAGNVASGDGFNYTIMGDTVNLAARLEEVNRTYGTRIILSDATRSQAESGFLMREVDLVRVRGREQQVTIFELVWAAPEETEPLWVLSFQGGRAAYLERDWRRAAEYFEEVIRLKPDDGPAALYLHRCRHYLESPPALDWDGVSEMEG